MKVKLILRKNMIVNGMNKGVDFMSFKDKLVSLYNPDPKLTYKQIKQECEESAKNSNYTYFWSCKVNKKDMQKLEQEGLWVELKDNAYYVYWN